MSSLITIPRSLLTLGASALIVSVVTLIRQRYHITQTESKLRNRITQLESRLLAASPESDWPHTYPLATSVSSLPSSLLTPAAKQTTSILFDLDGTLVESGQIWYELLNAASIEFGYGGLPYEVWLPTYGQSMQKNREMFYSKHTQKQLDDFCDEHYADYLQHLKILPGAVEALEATRQYLGGDCERMVICTNCPIKITKLIIESVPEISRYFSNERIVCASTSIRVKLAEFTPPYLPDYEYSHDEINELNIDDASISYQLKPKPSTDIIQRACNIVGTRAEGSIFIGDSKFDLQASMKAGCFAIGVGEKGKGGNLWMEKIGDLVKVLGQ